MPNTVLRSMISPLSWFQVFLVPPHGVAARILTLAADAIPFRDHALAAVSRPVLHLHVDIPFRLDAGHGLGNQLLPSFDEVRSGQRPDVAAGHMLAVIRVGSREC